jgi:ankyrin repeat protein
VKPGSGSRATPDLLAGLASQDGKTPLIIASSYGHWEVVGRLISSRAMVDVADKVLLSSSMDFEAFR